MYININLHREGLFKEYTCLKTKKNPVNCSNNLDTTWLPLYAVIIISKLQLFENNKNIPLHPL